MGPRLGTSKQPVFAWETIKISGLINGMVGAKNGANVEAMAGLGLDRYPELTCQTSFEDLGAEC